MMAEQQDPQAQTVRSPKRWPLVSRLQTRAPITVPLPGGTLMPITKDAHLINGFAEYDPEDKEFWIYKRLGLAATASFALGAGTPGGMYTDSLTFINAVQNNHLWRMNSLNAPVDNGAMAGAAPFYFNEANTGPGGVKYIVITSTNGAPGIIPRLFEIAPVPGFVALTGTPPQVGPGAAVLDGTVYVMNFQGSIFGSDLNNPVNWNALNVIQANADSDPGMFIAKQLSYVIAFKQWSTQVFFDNGNPTGSPLSPVPESQIPIGMLDNSSFQNIDDTLFWMTSNHDISPQIARLDNLTVKIVSTPAVEKILANYYYAFVFTGGPPVASAVPLISWRFKWGGHRFYGLTIQQLNVTLVYDIDQDFWYYWTDSFGNFWPVYSIAYQGTFINQSLTQVSFPGFRMAQHNTNGNLYALNAAAQTPTDLGALFPVDIYTPNVSFGNRRAQLNALYFTADQTTGSELLCRYTDNDFKRWSNFRSISLNQEKPALYREGTIISRRAYHFRHLCNTDFRIKSAGLQVDQGVL